uniref:Cytochrome F n=1 Tax=Cymopolia barbata TaxID=222010 RepID=A0A386JM58_9CHLO|nr:cytochrome F [Cymopolia barbata]
MNHQDIVAHAHGFHLNKLDILNKKYFYFWMDQAKEVEMLFHYISSLGLVLLLKYFFFLDYKIENKHFQFFSSFLQEYDLLELIQNQLEELKLPQHLIHLFYHLIKLV